MTPSNDFVIVNSHQNLRHIFSIFHLSECVIERITLSHIQGCISGRFHFDELQNNKRINLSRFRKKDRLIPIISLVFYYGSEPWDGPVDLYDMFRLEGTKEEKEILEKYLPNYKINLVDAERLEDVEKFSYDLQVILTMLRYRDSKEELKHYIDENKKFFQNVDYETSQAMKAFLNMKQIPGETEQKEETVDMCKAIQEMYDDGVKDGIQQGVEQGRTELLKEQIQRKLKKEKTPDQIAEELEESVEVIEKIIKEMQ